MIRFKNQGFSLVEVLIVVVIIGIIVAIAIPNLMGARRASNEASTVSAMRVLHGAQTTYSSTSGNGEFAGNANSQDTSGLAELHNANLIDNVLGSGYKSGFSFVGDRVPSSPGVPPTFYFSAIPISTSGISQTGVRRYGIATNGVVKADSTETDLGTHFDAVTLASAPPFNQ